MDKQADLKQATAEFEAALDYWSLQLPKETLIYEFAEKWLTSQYGRGWRQGGVRHLALAIKKALNSRAVADVLEDVTLI